jgi:hypothetical protein
LPLEGKYLTVTKGRGKREGDETERLHLGRILLGVAAAAEDRLTSFSAISDVQSWSYIELLRDFDPIIMGVDSSAYIKPGLCYPICLWEIRFPWPL